MAWQSYPWWDQPEGERQYRTFDPERGLEIIDEGFIGFSNLSQMRIKGWEMELRFLVRGRNDPERPNVVINQVDSRGFLGKPASESARTIIVEALEAFGSRYGFSRPGISFETEFVPFEGESN